MLDGGDVVGTMALKRVVELSQEPPAHFSAPGTGGSGSACVGLVAQIEGHASGSLRQYRLVCLGDY